MKTKTIAILSSLVALSAVTGCKKTPTEQPIKDIWGVVPELDYNGSLDIFCYIVGQNGVVNDIGSLDNKAALFDAALAKYHGAAKAWKEFYPNIKINVHYGGIDDYDTNVRNYQSMHNNHLPHLMHLPTTPQEGIAKGYNVDLSQYSYLSYYQAVNPNLFNYFTFGGFVSAVPMYIYPTGIFVNTKILRDEFLISEDDDYVQNFTFAEMVKWAKETANTERAGMGYVSEDILFNSAKTINYGLLNNRKVQLNTPEIRQTLELENELAAYTSYDYAARRSKDSYDFIKPYAYNTHFIDDQNYTMESSRSYASLLYSQMINENDDVGNFDFLPMPKLTEDDKLNIGVIAEGLVVGNQCPINVTCTENDKLAQEAAAAFA